MIMIGMSSALNLKITGRDAPSGRTEFTISSLSRTSFVKSSMSYPYSNKKRGRVGHGVAQTLDTTCRQATLVKTNKIMVEGNCFPSKHEAGRIVSENGISPTIKENHGTVTAVMKNAYPEYRIIESSLKDESELDRFILDSINIKNDRGNKA